MATTTNTETKPIWSANHYKTHRLNTPNEPHGLPLIPPTTPLKNQDKTVFKGSTSPPENSFSNKEEEEEVKSNNPPSPSCTPYSPYPSLSPTVSPSYTSPYPYPSPPRSAKSITKVTKMTKKSKTKPNQKLFLKLRCGKAIATPPRTPFNTTHPFFMQPARNQVRRAEFLEQVQEGVSPLVGKKGKGEVGMGKGVDLVDLVNEVGVEGGLEGLGLEGGEGVEGKTGQSKREVWLRMVLWGRGRWAVREEEEEW